jgi:hypothetical protein
MKALAVLIVPAICLAVWARDDPPPAPNKDDKSPLREHYQLAAKKYEFFLDKDRKVSLTFEPKPVFSWAQDDDWSGDVFVWTARGRPQVIGCVLSGPGKPERPEYHEFHTLSPEPLGSAEMPSKYRWAPEAGVKFQKFDGKPAATVAARLVQMRAITRDLKVFMEADGKWELRLLPQPLFRYQPPDGSVVDGALFAWVWTKGTDPELIVAVECHRTNDGLEWRYVPVRFTTREVWVKHDDKEVWRAPAHREGSGDVWTDVYTTRYAGKIAIPPPR